MTSVQRPDLRQVLSAVVAGLTRATTAPDPREVGQRIGVDHVVTSTLRRTPT